MKPSKLESARFRILKNDANGMRLRVQLPALRFVNRVGGGRTWTKLVLPKTDSPGRAGTPGIPMVSEILGVPDRRDSRRRRHETTSYTIEQVDVFPNQRESVDQSAPPTQPGPLRQSALQARSAPPTDEPASVPAEAADGRILGQSRDITLGNLRVPAAQYDAREEVAEGPELGRRDDRVRGRIAQLQRPARLALGAAAAEAGRGAAQRGDRAPRSAVRDRALRRGDDGHHEPVDGGRRQPARGRADARPGIRTNVFQTGGAPGQIGTTPTEIQAFIRGRLTAADCIHPSYVTIMGDDELVPTFPGIGGIESDLEYSLRDNADELPGRGGRAHHRRTTPLR